MCAFQFVQLQIAAILQVTQYIQSAINKSNQSKRRVQLSGAQFDENHTIYIYRKVVKMLCSTSQHSTSLRLAICKASFYFIRGFTGCVENVYKRIR